MLSSMKKELSIVIAESERVLAEHGIECDFTELNLHAADLLNWIHGVYVLIDDCVPVYVGQSSNIVRRICGHLSECNTNKPPTNGRPFVVKKWDRVIVTKLDPSVMNIAEKRLTHELRPKYNSRWVANWRVPPAMESSHQRH
jgi:hypothetical protein